MWRRWRSDWSVSHPSGRHEVSPADNVTIADVAERAGVSPALVSFVLNNRPDVAPETRQRILDIIKELGYAPNAHARSLAKKQAGAVGFVLEMRGYQDSFVLHFLAAIGEKLADTATRLMLLPSGQPHELMDVARQGLVDALLLMDVTVEDPRLPVLHEYGMPTVLFGQGGPQHFAVDIDYAKAASEAARHLAERGFRHAALISGPENYIYIKERLRHWQLALHRSGVGVTGVWSGALDQSWGKQAAHLAVAAAPRPDVLVALTDALAIGAEHELLERGLKVPQDIGVLGFGDIPSAAWAPVPLATLAVPFGAMGHSAADLLVAAARHESPRVITFAPTLVQRQST